MLLEALLDIIRKVRPKDTLSGIAFDPVSENEWVPEIPWFERIGNSPKGGRSGRIRQALSFAIISLLISSRFFWFLRHFLPLKQRQALEQLAEADLAISCPGGYLEDSNSAYILNLFQVLLACRLSSRVILAPQSIGPIKSRFGQSLVKYVVSKVDKIFVREPESLAFLNKVIGEANWHKYADKISLVGDLAFWFDRANTDSVDSEFQRLGIESNKLIFGLTVVGWNFPHAADPAAKREDYLNALSDLVKHVNTIGKYQIVVFNQVVDDLTLGREFARRNPSVILDTFQRDSGLFCKLISKCDIFIGTRFHSCIFGLLGAVPTAAIAYLPKTTGIMCDLELEEYVVSIDDVSGAQLIKLYDTLVANRDNISYKIANQVESYKASRSNFIQYLADLKG